MLRFSASRFLLPAFLLACGAPCGLSAARDRWQVATGLVVPETVLWEFPAVKEVPCETAIGAGPFFGCTKADKKRVVVAANAFECELVTLHEYGHVLGAAHVANGVMRSEIAAARHCLTEEDVDAVCAVADCRWRKPECR